MTPEPICSPQLERALEDALRAADDPLAMETAIRIAIIRAGVAIGAKPPKREDRGP